MTDQFRLLLPGLAYVPVGRPSTLALEGTGFAKLRTTTLRAKLLKIGAVIPRNTHRARVMLGQRTRAPLAAETRRVPRFRQAA